ncbi:MAG TPA: alcohol dehydrogenase catalytic domain-containing protein [Burkholderiaceae bacterium]|nr:alcohol dehydrogenase catalytic domain-containing protein [Burkholderiaceae bacterium]
MSTAHLVAAFDRFGASAEPVLRRLPLPAPGRGEIAVRVQAASVNPIDVRRRGGYGRKLFRLMGAARLPLVLGNDFAGTVTAVGAGVRGVRVGDAVFGAKPPSSAGTHAQHVVVRAEHAAPSPGGIPATVLAALPYNYLTVRRALADAGIDRASAHGRAVLVHGAGGGLGLLALHILHGWGAHVTATCGAAAIDTCRRAGALHALDYRRMPLAGLPRRFAATLNFADWDDEAALLALLAPGALGHATTVHPMLGNVDRLGLLRGGLATLRQRRQWRARVPAGARYAWTVFRPDHAALAELAELAARLAAQLAAQVAAPLTDHVPGYAALTSVVPYDLSDAAQAFRHVEQRRPGRAVLLPPA